MTRVALIMAGGTGGHIFPGLAVAEGLRQRGWRVHWLGAPEPSMESRLVPMRGFELHAVEFGGLRGKGLSTLMRLPMRLFKAFAQSRQILTRLKPQVVVGLGGYISFPGGCMARALGLPLVVHEQNAVAGMANRWLSRWAQRAFCAFPDALPHGIYVGNPLRAEFLNQAAPAVRFQSRSGPLRLLVVGGSLGAQALNRIVPQALGLMAPEQRPEVMHQSGVQHIDALRQAYADVNVQAVLTPFIDDMATAFAQADLVICRAGASTVTELAAIGVASILVPFPHAVDDHQTLNAQFLAKRGAAWLCPQHELTPQALADQIGSITRSELLSVAQLSFACRQTQAVQDMLMACEELAA
jgi:UDP-N-acetylglucosamine--N-acetylmuramyl-(pentapeptide) pyrophosphoryl-undecaprenol N-acetylglucosamine transferase